MKRSPRSRGDKSAWQDVSLTIPQRVRALLEAATSRGEVKRLGAWLDGPELVELRAELVRQGEARGVSFPEAADQLPGKRLLRLARGMEDAARVRKNPIARDEAFVCASCAREVPPHGRTARDHCPWCLCSLHVDRVPGDRAEDCGGILEPIQAELRGDEVVLSYRCRRCGAARTNRALLDGDCPDDWSLITRVAAREGTG